MTLVEEYRYRLILNGVKKLTERGMSEVTKDSILRDKVYSNLFKTFLEESYGVGGAYDIAINLLLEEIK